MVKCRLPQKNHSAGDNFLLLTSDAIYSVLMKPLLYDDNLSKRNF